MKTYIYGLHDENDILRYVGKAQSPDKRFKAHISPGQLRRYRSKKNSWIKSMLASGNCPRMSILSVVDESEANQEEIRIIALMKDCGFNLTNGTDGGDGGAITDPAAKARFVEKMTGRKASDETRKLMSVSAVEVGKDPALRKIRSENSLRLGLKPPAQGIGSKNTFAKLDEVKVLEIKKLLANGVTGKEIANMYGVTAANVSAINKNKTWKHVKLT